MLKKFFILTSSLIVILFLLVIIYFNLPIEVTRKSDIERGNLLITNILNYKKNHGKLPECNNYQLLKSIGFTDKELQNAYPEYYPTSDSTFQLIFVLGFDPPYLFWDSKEKEWKEDFPDYIQQEK